VECSAVLRDNRKEGKKEEEEQQQDFRPGNSVSTSELSLPL